MSNFRNSINFINMKEPSLIQKDILQQEMQLYKAMKESDLDLLDDLLHDDLLFVLPSGDTITKEMDLNVYREGKLKIIDLNPTIEQLNIIDDLAVITLTVDIKGVYDSESFEAKYRYIRFWKKFDDGIKVVGGSGIGI